MWIAFERNIVVLPKDEGRIHSGSDGRINLGNVIRNEQYQVDRQIEAFGNIYIALSLVLLPELGRNVMIYQGQTIATVCSDDHQLLCDDRTRTEQAYLDFFFKLPTVQLCSDLIINMSHQKVRSIEPYPHQYVQLTNQYSMIVYDEKVL